MFRNLAEDIAFVLIKNKIIDIEQHDVYVYGAEVFLLNASLLIILLVISFAFKALVHFVAFMVFFFPLRIFAGGYHAKTSEMCLVLSIIMYAVSLAIVQIIPLLYKSVYAMAAEILFLTVIFIFAPIVNKNNELNSEQLKRNKIIVRTLLLIDIAGFVLCYLLNLTVASSEIVFTSSVAILLLIEKVLKKQKNS